MSFSGAVSLILLAAFAYVGWLANFWAVVFTWDMQTWLVVIFAVMVTWIARNEFGGHG